MKRIGKQHRKTAETEIEVLVSLDGGKRTIEVPDGFFAHMLDALSKHGALGLELRAKGDIHIDLHHTVEDVGIAIGDALHKALGERRGIRRFASAYAPLDEALARSVVDLSGRGFYRSGLGPELRNAWVTRDFPLTLVDDFLQALADRGRMTLHVDVLEGRNPHHVAEAIFKSVALALRSAVEVTGDQGVPSTKGTLSV